MLNDIQDVLREYKGDDELTVTPETSFADLSLDSLDTVELVMSIEDKFGVSIEMNGDVNTVGDLMTAIEKAKQA
ncbi:MAG: phosphopantetheine-binding protein [Propionibacteriaceae bacterium]|jgi:acyl carrier protein|nr:phosphopantetheine-binding protein [Propionibacteriaceae bacterium]